MAQVHPLRQTSFPAEITVRRVDSIDKDDNIVCCGKVHTSGLISVVVDGIKLATHPSMYLRRDPCLLFVSTTGAASDYRVLYILLDSKAVRKAT